MKHPVGKTPTTKTRCTTLTKSQNLCRPQLSVSDEFLGFSTNTTQTAGKRLFTAREYWTKEHNTQKQAGWTFCKYWKTCPVCI